MGKGQAHTTHVFRKSGRVGSHGRSGPGRKWCASIAYWCNVDALMRHYVAMDEQQVTDDVFEQMNGKQSVKQKIKFRQGSEIDATR